MASDDPHPDEVPRLDSRVVRQVAEAVRRLAAANPNPATPRTGLPDPAAQLHCTTAALESRVVRSQSATDWVQIGRDSLSEILGLLDSAIARARAQAVAERPGSAAEALQVTRTHAGFELQESDARLKELLQLGRYFETGAANINAAIPLAPGAAKAVPCAPTSTRCSGRLEVGEDAIRYILEFRGKVRPRDADMNGETQI